MNITPINYQPRLKHNKVNKTNQKTDTSNVTPVAFKGIKFTPKIKNTNTVRNIVVSSVAAIATVLTAVKVLCHSDKGYNSALKNRVIAMGECDSFGKAPEYAVEYEKKNLKYTYIKNPELTKELMNSTLKDGYVTWVEYSADAIDLIVENNKLHPEKTEMLKKCLSRSYEFDDSNYEVIDIVNKSSDEEIQNALIKAGYQEDKVYHYPKTFYSPHLFTKQFDK